MTGSTNVDIMDQFHGDGRLLIDTLITGYDPHNMAAATLGVPWLHLAGTLRTPHRPFSYSVQNIDQFHVLNPGDVIYSM